MRNKQDLTAIRPLDGVLAMSTMRFADEIVARKEIDELPARRAKPAAKEAGKDVVGEEPEQETSADIVDLTEALQRSLDTKRSGPRRRRKSA